MIQENGQELLLVFCYTHGEQPSNALKELLLVMHKYLKVPQGMSSITSMSTLPEMIYGLQ